MDLAQNVFENADLIAVTGVSAVTLQSWANRGILPLPENRRNPGAGKKRLLQRPGYRPRGGDACADVLRRLCQRGGKDHGANRIRANGGYLEASALPGVTPSLRLHRRRRCRAGDLRRRRRDGCGAYAEAAACRARGRSPKKDGRIRCGARRLSCFAAPLWAA